MKQEGEGRKQEMWLAQMPTRSGDNLSPLYSDMVVAADCRRYKRNRSAHDGQMILQPLSQLC